MFRIIIASVVLISLLIATIYTANKLGGESNKQDIHSYTIDKPIVMRTKGGLLEVSSVVATEHIESSVINTFLGMDVAKTTARIRVPAVYRYTIVLAPEWEIHFKDNVFIVVAPAVKPSLPVAIDTTKLVADSSGTLSLITGQKRIDEAIRTITPTLTAKAVSQQYIELQRNEARKTVEEFVRKWLITQEQWKAASNLKVQVRFVDEPV